MSINTQKYIEHFLRIRDKRTNIIPLKLNTAQQKLYDALAMQHRAGKPMRAIVLKARQMGFSTLTEAMIFKRTACAPHVSSGIVAHREDSTTNLFVMSKRFYDHLPREMRPRKKASNAKELSFADLGSNIRCMTAGGDGIGRSDTFQNLHISEYAMWRGNKEETLLGLMQAVPNAAGTMVVIESTANGYDDFKKLWDAAVRAESGFVPVFCAWWEHAEYAMPYAGEVWSADELEQKRLYDLSDEQLVWRRWCIANNCGGNTDLFRQEYPASADEAFLMSGRPVFDNEVILKRIAELERQKFDSVRFVPKWRDAATQDKIVGYDKQRGQDIRIYEHPRPNVPYVIGGDTKGEGKDYYAATVIDNRHGKRVATLHMQLMHSHPFTHQLYCLGKYYNDALIGVEHNFNQGPIEELERLGYPHQYRRQRHDDIHHGYQKKWGFRTDGTTRPLIIDKEIDMINNHVDLFFDIPTLREALTFVYDERNRPDALTGEHDDLLMSDMIANEIRGQQSHVEHTAAEERDEVEEFLSYE